MLNFPANKAILPATCILLTQISHIVTGDFIFYNDKTTWFPQLLLLLLFLRNVEYLHSTSRFHRSHHYMRICMSHLYCDMLHLNDKNSYPTYIRRYLRESVNSFAMSWYYHINETSLALIQYVHYTDKKINVQHIYPPLQTTPFPVKPLLHWQRKLPLVFIHWELLPQLSKPSRHSFTSIQHT